MRSRVATRVKSALLAASIVAIFAGSFQLLGNIFDFSIFDTIESKIAANIDSDVRRRRGGRRRDRRRHSER